MIKALLRSTKYKGPDQDRHALLTKPPSKRHPSQGLHVLTHEAFLSTSETFPSRTWWQTIFLEALLQEKESDAWCEILKPTSEQ